MPHDSLDIPRLLVSAAHKSSGKTMITLGLAAALAQRGHRVQTFKKGPDYIDPMWLTQASGRACYNLDAHLMAPADLEALFSSQARGADLCLVEGNKGLHDGVALDGSNSSAALARQLALPVLLVIDARGMTRGIAPLLMGYQVFDPTVKIAGVILNKVGGPRHESKLRAAIEHYTDLPVVGAVQADAGMEIAERHLGLVPSNEAELAQAQVRRVRDLVASQVDLERVIALARQAPDMPARPVPVAPAPRRCASQADATTARLVPLRIGVPIDRAFGFYYPDDLEALRAAGAEIVPFDTLHDHQLPDIDALFIGGGFPEMLAAELAANTSLRGAIRRAIEAGLPTYAECGGLMYLARSITALDGSAHPMVGAIAADVRMHRRPIGRGYIALAPTDDTPWPAADTDAICGTDGASPLRGHEFHYSALENIAPGTRYAYRVLRGHGIDGQHDGLIVHRLLASYAHLRSLGGTGWPARFVAYIHQCREQDGRPDHRPAHAATLDAVARPTSLEGLHA